MNKEKVSLIIPVKNEEKNIDALFMSITNQNKMPAEVVVVDGGSNDKTVEKILKWKNRIPLVLIQTDQANPAQGRNLAIKYSRHEILALTDAGCILNNNWLLEITQPLIENKAAVAGGQSLPFGKSFFQKCLGIFSIASFQKSKDTRNPSSRYLPSTKNTAFCRSVWEKVGGFPEWLATAEDSYFFKKARAINTPFYYNPMAQLDWMQRNNVIEFFRQYFRYAWGDGLSRLFIFQHTRKLLIYIIGIILLIFGINNMFYLFIFISLSLIYLSFYIIKAFQSLGRMGVILYVPWLAMIRDIAMITGFLAGLILGFFQNKTSRKPKIINTFDYSSDIVSQGNDVE